MEFNAVWRKRLACERCRHLKVRCEYSSPTTDTCIRCEKSGTPCIIPHPKRKDGQAVKQENGKGFIAEVAGGNRSETAVMADQQQLSGGSKEDHAVYLKRIIRDAQEKLSQIDVSPLRQAIAAKVYTVEEAQEFYSEFLDNPCVFPLIGILGLPTSIVDLDRQWPWLSIAAVTVRAMNTSTKASQDMALYIQDLYKSDLEPFSSGASLDRLVGFAIMCQYALPHRERGLNALLQLHGLTVSTMRQLRSSGEFELEHLALQIGASTILPYVIVRNFAPMNQISYFYHGVMNDNESSSMAPPHKDSMIMCSKGSGILEVSEVLSAGPLMEMILEFQRAIDDISTAATLEDVGRIIETSLQSIQLLENHTALINLNYNKERNALNTMSDSIPDAENLLVTPLRGCFLMVKMQLARAAASRALDLRMIVPPEETARFLRTLIGHTAGFAGQLFRSFAHINSKRPIVHTSTYYYVSEALLILQLMRFVSFAGGVDVDVRSDCLLQIVVMKWEEIMATSMLARQLFVLLFPPLDTSNVKIGSIDPKSNSVIGPGNMDEFDIVSFNGQTKKILDQKRFSREDLLELIDNETRKSITGASQLEEVNALSLPTVLHLLLAKRFV